MISFIVYNTSTDNEMINLSIKIDNGTQVESVSTFHLTLAEASELARELSDCVREDEEGE